ncbi:MAG: hypothetical protein F6K11_07385 [Leptolyngbya sp. SIO3F4]|nr:hypothetical protein [Leptolyngbya sp. SIO3F4]
MRKNKWILCCKWLIIATLVLPSCSEKALLCSDFHDGEFTFSASSNVRILREGDRQTEYSLEDDFVDKYRILWIDSCTYQAVLEETNRPEDLDFRSNDTLTVTIIETAEKGYRYTASKPGKTFEGTLIFAD